MLIKKEERKEKQITKDISIAEYPLHNKNLGIALAKINGRFPDSGKTANKVCQEIYYVIGEKEKYLLKITKIQKNFWDAENSFQFFSIRNLN